MATAFADTGVDDTQTGNVADNDAGTPRDFESEASKHGWTPKDEFKGDPNRWVDAETFVKRADEVMPLLKKKTEAQDREIADLKKQIKRANEFFSKAEERAYNAAYERLREEQRAAVASGDTEAFDRVGEKIDALKKDLPTEAQTPKVTEAQARQAWDDWRDENTWYDKANLASASEEMVEARLFADRMMEKHVAKTAEMPPEEYFSYIEGLVVEKFPGLKAKPARKKPASDVAAPTNGRQSQSGHSFSDLPAEAQRMADKWVKSGLIKSREEYVKNYDWS